MMQVDGSARSACSPRWQVRQLSIGGISTSALVSDVVAAWQSVQAEVSCAP